MHNVPDKLAHAFDFRQSIVYFVDTFPRSGTHYVLDILETHGGVDYSGLGTRTRELALARPRYEDAIQSDGVFFCVPPATNRYVLKTHFFMPRPEAKLLAPEVVCLRQISFFLDGIYSWAHLITKGKVPADELPEKYEAFRVGRESFAWQKIRGHFPVLLKWLETIDRSEVVRYEDYADPASAGVQRLAACLGRPPEVLFAGFAPDPRRLYYAPPEDFGAVASARFEPDVYAEVVDVLGPYFREFYPEISL